MMRQDSTASRGGMSEKEKDFVKFMRHFCTRLVQSVVQARMGQMAVAHSCSPTPETPDWFNLIVDEIGEIAAYMKSGIKNYPPKCSALSLDFLLHTADGDSLPLESWVVRVDRNQLDENVNVHTALYHQMSTLLKSVIMASRFTPSYRYYVRKQSPETFVLFYGRARLVIAWRGTEVQENRLLPTPLELYILICTTGPKWK
uniref:Autophagy-related protein 13 n=1 Tax=Ditylenchus dipsaci TaxID=166011 RepID=A0A915EL74_9BILA